MKLQSLLATALAATALGFALDATAPTATATGQAAEAKTLTIDPVHTSVNFRVKHMGASWSTGRFNEVAGEIKFDADDFTKSSVQVTIQTASVDTNDAKRDEHLKGPDFFTVKQHPTMVFKSKSIEPADGGFHTVNGTIEWMGQTKEIDAMFEHVGQGEMRGKELHGFHAEFTILRSEFGIDYGLPDALGDEVYVTVDIEATL